MQSFSEVVSIFESKVRSHAWGVFQVLAGGLLIVVGSHIVIPFYPVPITTQTFMIFLLALIQGGRIGACSALLYVNVFRVPLLFSWQYGINYLCCCPTSGYLIAFPIAAFIVGKMVEIYEERSPLWLIFSILVGYCVIYLFGALGLMRFMSCGQSVKVGILPFLYVDGIKLLLTVIFGGLWLNVKRRMREGEGLLG